MAIDERKEAKQLSGSRGRSEMSQSRHNDWSFWNAPFDDPFGFLRRRGSNAAERDASWMPDVETFQRGGLFVVRADLPGMKIDDITLQITDDALTIEGERRSEHEGQREGYFRSERRYGTFCRVVPLPEGAIADSAKANFENGVLEVVMQAPPRDVSRGRRLEIGGPRTGREPDKQIFPE